VHAGNRQRESHAAANVVGLVEGLVPGGGEPIAVRPRLARHRLDGHHTDVPLGTQLEQSLGVAAIVSVGPHAGIDGEHDGVKVPPS
jgi:hypothetical protein